MVDSSSRTEPHLGKLKENKTLSGPLVFLSDLTQDDAISDAFHAVDSSNLHKIHTALTEVFSKVEQADLTAAETEEHSTDFRNEPQEQAYLESPIIKLLGALDEVESLVKTTSGFEAQTDQGFPNPSHEPPLDGTGDGILFPATEETRIDPNARADYPKTLSGTTPERSEHTGLNSETQKQVGEETDTSEPPAKKRVRRRMGMCGLGDRKRKFLSDGQHCRQGVVGRQREGVQHLGNTVLEIDGFISVEHEGTSRPACGDPEEVLKGMENNQAAEDEKGNRYAQNNSMKKCTSQIKDEGSTEESPEENTDDPSEGVSVENVASVITDEKITTEQVVLEHQLNAFEDKSSGAGRTLLSPTVWENTPLIKNKLSVDASTSDCGMEPATCGEEPKFSVLERTGMKHDVLSEKPDLHADHEVNVNPDRMATEDEVSQEVSFSLMCATVQRPEGSVVVSKKVQTGFQGSETQPEGRCRLSVVSPERPGPSGSTENVWGALLVDKLGIAADACVEIQNSNGHGTNHKPSTAAPESTEPDADDAEEIGKHTAPSAGQDNRVHCRLDHEACDTPVTPSVAEQVCNPTVTAAADELPPEADWSDPSLLYSMTDSQLHRIALSVALEDQPLSGGTDQQEDATELVRGLIREVSSLNRTVMAAHREMELLRRGKLPKAPNRRLGGPRPYRDGST